MVETGEEYRTQVTLRQAVLLKKREETKEYGVRATKKRFKST